MAFNFRKLFQGINIVPKPSSTVNSQGDMDVDSGDGKLNYHNGTSASPVVTEAHTATLINKTISFSNNTFETSATSGYVLKSDGSNATFAAPQFNGTVTSVGLTLPNIFDVTGSPVTTSGTIAAALSTQSQNTLFASPSGGDGTPSFRKAVANDVNSGSATSGQVLTADGSGAASWATSSSAPTSSLDLNNLGLSAVSSGIGAAFIITMKTAAGSNPSGSDIVSIGYRNTTAATGTYNFYTVSASNTLIIPQSTTIGTQTGTTHNIYVYAVNSTSSTTVLGVSLALFDEGSLQSSSAISGGADPHTLYTLSALSNVPIRLIGRLVSTQTTAGQWLSDASQVSVVPFSKIDQVIPVTTTYSALSTDSVIRASANSGAFTITLPTAAGLMGKVYSIKKIDSSANSVTVATTSSQTIDGVIGSSLTLQNECLTLVSDGSNWKVLNRYYPPSNDEIIVNTPTSFGSTANKIVCFSTVQKASSGAITYVPDSVNGDKFTINQPGLYSVYTCVRGAANDFIGASLNSTQLTTSIGGINIGNIICVQNTTILGYDTPVTRTLRLVAGDVVRAHCGGSSATITSSTFNNFIISKICN